MASEKPFFSAAILDRVQIMYRPAALAAEGAVAGSGRRHLAHSSRMPFALVAASK